MEASEGKMRSGADGNKVSADYCEEFGYDIELTYVKRDKKCFSSFYAAYPLE